MEGVMAHISKRRLFADLLGIALLSEQQMVSLIESHLPLETLSRLEQHGLSRDEVFSLIINPRTLKHRRSKRQALSLEESERAVRVSRILATAHATLCDDKVALDWLRKPKRRFDGRTPMQMLSTETGGRLVEQMLLQIDEGMFA
jgi:putative toxin-antitoxin system antitoxin component (TIGR02293 family)